MNLGPGTSMGMRRVNSTCAGRVRKEGGRCAKVELLVRTTSKGRKVIRPGAVTQAAWETEIHGYSQSGSVEGSTCRSLGIQAPTSLSVTSIWVLLGPEADPEVKNRSGVAKLWTELMDGDPDLRDKAAEVWAQARGIAAWLVLHPGLERRARFQHCS